MKKTKIFWRKRYTGYSTGTLGGRDDGYPEEHTQKFYYPDGLARLAELHGTRRDEKYELVSQTVTPLTAEQVKGMVRDGLKQVQEAEEKAQRAADEAEFERLAQKLGK